MPNLHRIPPLQHPQRPRKRTLRIPPPINKFPLQRRQTRAPPNGQSSPQFLLHFPNLFHQLLATAGLALRHGIHSGSKEQANRLVDVLFRCDGGECEFRERLRDADYGFELSDCDWDA